MEQALLPLPLQRIEFLKKALCFILLRLCSCSCFSLDHRGLYCLREAGCEKVRAQLRLADRGLNELFNKAVHAKAWKLIEALQPFGLAYEVTLPVNIREWLASGTEEEQAHLIGGPATIWSTHRSGLAKSQLCPAVP